MNQAEAREPHGSELLKQIERILIAVARRSPSAANFLRNAARRVAGRHNVATIAVVIDPEGRVLVSEHAIRQPAMGLPGGWLNRHEDPSAGVTRELNEETGLAIVPRRVVAVESHVAGNLGKGTSGITIAFWCSLARNEHTNERSHGLSAELLSIQWLSFDDAIVVLSDFEATAVNLARGDWQRDNDR